MPGDIEDILCAFSGSEDIGDILRVFSEDIRDILRVSSGL